MSLAYASDNQDKEYAQVKLQTINKLLHDFR